MSVKYYNFVKRHTKKSVAEAPAPVKSITWQQAAKMNEGYDPGDSFPW